VISLNDLRDDVSMWIVTCVCM